MDKCIILIPSLNPSGPIKGAVGLANGLSDLGVCVTLVALRSGPGANSKIDAKVNVFDLGFSSNLSVLSMIKAVKRIVSQLRTEEQPKLAVISMCFSADVVNFFSHGATLRISSVRGDLAVNYSMDNKYTGKLVSNLHYFMLKYFDLTFAMNEEMMNLLVKKKFQKVSLVPNFLNERDLIAYRKQSAEKVNDNVIFVGSLSDRKKPHLVIEAVAGLNKKGYSIGLKVLGIGPLFKDLSTLVTRLDDERIELIGFCNNPMIYLKAADIFVLPSLSEGTPRAVMEALYVGVPCVLRNLGTNDNLVVDGVNGVLFEKDHELESAILKAIELQAGLNGGESLLGTTFSQVQCSKNVLAEIESLY
ncbi:glycosyltransferase [Pseudomonadales bacterium]|nr:glycosyltransferase [Pseudomonadales bacterium]